MPSQALRQTHTVAMQIIWTVYNVQVEESNLTTQLTADRVLQSTPTIQSPLNSLLGKHR